MARFLHKSHIRNFIVDFAQREGVFYEEAYEPESNLGEVIESLRITPTSVTANEVSASFAPSSVRYTRWVLDRTNWRWQLNLQFAQKASLEAFELQLMDIPRIPLETADRSCVRLLLQEAEYVHPPAHEASLGTRATYFFNAEVISP